MKKVAVYCSSRSDLPVQVEQGAAAILKSLGDNAASLVYGGVNAGLMHFVAQAAADAGAPVIGIVPEVFAHRADALCTEIIHTSDLNTRKAAMIDMADIFVVLPGGIGTIDEWISTLSHIMVREKVDASADKPILVWNFEGMYDGLIAQLSDTADSVYARGKNVDRSRIFTDPLSLADALSRLLR